MLQKYLIVSSDHSIEHLETIVNLKLKEGWRCQGGITRHNKELLQALIKEIPSEKIKPNS